MPSRIELYGSKWPSAEEAPVSLTSEYNGFEYRITVRLAPGADGIGLDEEDAQRLARWLGWEARREHGQQQAERQWRPSS